MTTQHNQTKLSACTNFLSIDVEDYFQVSAFEKISPPSTWDTRELRVEANTERVLKLLDEADVKATFFVLGWIAQRCPQLVKNIAAKGHEIASHGSAHQRVGTQTRSQFAADVLQAKTVLEDLTGTKVLGYRAPSYSISQHTPWAFDELLAAGYRYDSSIFPMKHDFYGMADWPRFAGYAVKNNEDQWCPAGADELSAGQLAIHELPITTLRLGGKNLPIAGGGYFRLLPYVLTRWGLRHINQLDNQPFVFYLHPWEFDPAQPRMVGASSKSRLRHYLNLAKTEGRFKRLLNDFEFGTIRAGLGL
jgi:polysaccharide deacetylase family protein (PEP-CTERM system associated)